MAQFSSYLHWYKSGKLCRSQWSYTNVKLIDHYQAQYGSSFKSGFVVIFCMDVLLQMIQKHFTSYELDGESHSSSPDCAIVLLVYIQITGHPMVGWSKRSAQSLSCLSTPTHPPQQESSSSIESVFPFNSKTCWAYRL